MSMELVGTWRLVSVHRRSNTGRIEPFLGEHPKGLLIYSADGHMAAVMTSGDRPSFRGNDAAHGTPEEKASAFDTVVAYAGPYTLAGNQVTHDVEVSWFPNWVGGQQRRTITLEGDQLSISTQPIIRDGEEWVFELIWKRASGAS